MTDDEILATTKLIGMGYHRVSNRQRLVARIPSTVKPPVALEERHTLRVKSPDRMRIPNDRQFAMFPASKTEKFVKAPPLPKRTVARIADVDVDDL